MRMTRLSLLAGGAVFAATAAFAESFEYTVGDTVFQGYIARPAAEARGTVLIVHDWDGLNAHEIARADAMAQAGYVGVALDLFGRDAELNSIDDYRRETGALYADRDEFRARIAAGAQAAAVLDDVPAGTKCD